MNFPQVRPDRISEATSVGLAVPTTVLSPKYAHFGDRTLDHATNIAVFKKALHQSTMLILVAYV
jgi:hypothetical protein